MMNAFGELKIFGLRPRWSPLGEVIAVSRDINGQWFACKKNGYHEITERTFLPLSLMPNLKQALSDYESKDSNLRVFGGRVFVGKLGVHRKS